MTKKEAIEYNKNLKLYMKISDKTSPYKFLEENYIALDMAIKALENESCQDTISRKATINSMYAMHMHGKEGVLSDIKNLHGSEACFSETIVDAVEKLENLPSVTPARSSGKWREHICVIIGNYDCPFCGSYTREKSDFCPNCGAYMRDEVKL